MTVIVAEGTNGLGASWEVVDTTRTPHRVVGVVEADTHIDAEMAAEEQYRDIVKLIVRPATSTPAAPPPLMSVTLPSVPTTSGRTYTVKPGDSLSLIAKNHGRPVTDWKSLYVYGRNTVTIGRNPDRITAGMVLDIPPSWGEYRPPSAVQSIVLKPQTTRWGVGGTILGAAAAVGAAIWYWKRRRRRV